ncbi:hypothetical protein ENSA5_35960 [Enhygromyxa salina]|uniref:Uncharacterized protein n=1 Tax=Enhygromyxa salina TaxID=215803 RepID=A0A2S9XUV6_9BACT|nr:hypothetical protein [Enhygromyxa salina]PRP96520.1 hypothetical protein ENSA5_35960 [Enhygromyxa salina]
MTVHIVASCTERKRASVPKDLRVRALADGPVEQRAARWLVKLASSEATPKQARDLYGGEHWKLVLELESALRDERDRIELSVASAGYGLVSADEPLRPYSATFAARQPDSVVRPQDQSDAWWRVICAGRGAPNCLETLVAGAEGLVVIASAKYLRAMLPDLLRARDALPDPDHLVVFAGSDLAELGPSLIRVDARVQVALNTRPDDRLRGSKQGLAARTAKELLCRTRTWPPTATSLAKAYHRLVADVMPPPILDRVRHEDDGVRAFIGKSLEENPRAGWTSLLRAWRSSGQACEQKRFKRLHGEVKAKRS